MVNPSRPDDSREEMLVAYSADDSIYAEGSSGAEMFIIEEGTIELFRKIGPEDRRLAILERGDFFGERSLLEDRPRENSARALTDCRLLPIDASTFDQMLREHPEIAIRMLRSLCRRLRAHEEADQRAGAIAAGALASTAGEPEPATAPVREQPPPTAAVEAPMAALNARLVHASDAEFPIAAEGVTQIGRSDAVTRIAPDVDLQQLDTKHTLSRQHAKIIAAGGRFVLSEHIGTANGTFVGSRKLATGEEHEIRDGDRLRFGLLQLVFRVGERG